ncbi:Annexin A6 [Chamberlinius hualienensis]
MSYPGYPGQDPSYPGYPSQDPSYPAYPSYPPQQPVGYSPGGLGYESYPQQPPLGFNIGNEYQPPHIPGYPPNMGGGYPGGVGGYPPQPPFSPAGPYPPMPGAYPMQTPGYPMPPQPFAAPYPPLGAPNPALYAQHPSAPAVAHLAVEGAVLGAAVEHEERKEEVKKEIHEEKKEHHEEVKEHKEEHHEEVKELKEVNEIMEKEHVVAKVAVAEEVKEVLSDDEHEHEHKEEKIEEKIEEKTIEDIHTEGTVKEHHPFEPKEDAAALKKAMKGFGTKENIIVDILANRTNEQRMEIALEYKTAFGKDLIKNLKSELGGHFEDAVMALMTPREKYLAECLHKAMAGAGTKDRVLIEILCSATNKEIHKINEFYKELYKRELEKDITGDTSGYFKNLLVAINCGNRDESKEVSHDKAKKDAEALYQAGAKKWGTNESIFSKIIVSQSYPQLRAAFAEYEKLYNHTIESVIKKEMSGDLQNGILALVMCIKDKEKFFAEQIQQATKGMGTKDHTLIRLIVTRSEIDLKEIKEEYHKCYGKALEAIIKSEAGGDYKKVLLAVLH